MKKKEIIDSKHVDHIENEKKILEVLEHPFIVSNDFAFPRLTDFFFSWTISDLFKTICISISWQSY